jgi:hypothetical protein
VDISGAGTDPQDIKRLCEDFEDMMNSLGERT